MYKRSLLFIALALAAICRCAPALANDDADDSHLGSGIHDVTDPELADMRGRYVAGNDAVVYFGVEMITTWQTNTGQTLQGTLTIGMDFAKNPNSPQVTFVPTVTITTPDAPLPTASTVQPTVNRNVQSGGIANVGGFVQSVQIAGDNNAVANVTSLNIQSGGSAPSTSTTSNNTSTVTSTPSSTNTTGAGGSLADDTTAPSNSSSTSSASVSVSGPMANTNSSTTTTSPTSHSSTTNDVASTSSNASTGSAVDTGNSISNGRSVTVGGSTVTSTYSNNSAEVTTSVIGEGSVSQFVHPGSIGQEIELATDNAIVTNQMIVNLVTQQLGSTEQLAHTLAQSMNLSHLYGH